MREGLNGNVIMGKTGWLDWLYWEGEAGWTGYSGERLNWKIIADEIRNQMLL